jgi:hypothetical protein
MPCVSIELQDITLQQTVHFVVTALRIGNLTNPKLWWEIVKRLLHRDKYEDHAFYVWDI